MHERGKIVVYRPPSRIEKDVSPPHRVRLQNGPQLGPRRHIKEECPTGSNRHSPRRCFRISARIDQFNGGFARAGNAALDEGSEHMLKIRRLHIARTNLV
jgi:hypothetical protein